MPDRLQILIVEDNDDIRRALSRLVQREGHSVAAAATVAEGIAKFDGHAIALLDLELPDGLGTDVLQHIRNQSRQTRIAFITAAYHLEHAKMMLSPGDTIFQKPLDIKDLITWINQDA